MSTIVRRTGLVGNHNKFQSRGQFTLSDGSAVVVVLDRNRDNSRNNTYGDRDNTERYYVYHSVDRLNWTLRATIDSPLSANTTITANLSFDDTLGIVAYSSTSVRYISVNCTTWVVAATQTPRTVLSGTYEENHFDLTFTEGNVPVIVALRTATSGGTRCRLWTYTRRTSDSSWQEANLIALESSNTPKRAFLSVSIAALTAETPVAASRNIAIALSHGVNTNDKGIKVYTAKLNETSAAWTEVTQRYTFADGDVPGRSSAAASRNLMMFQSDYDEYTLGVQHGEGKKRFGVVVGFYDGTDYDQLVPWTYTQIGANISSVNLAMTYSSGRLAFYSGDGPGRLRNWLAKYDGDSETYKFGARRWFDNQSREPVWGLMSGGGPNVWLPNHDLTFVHKIANDRQEIAHHWVRPTRSPELKLPANGATLTTSTPALRALADLDLKYPQSLIKLRYEFATDTLFETEFFEYEQDDEQLKYIGDTHLIGSSVLIEDKLPEEFDIRQATWYARVAQVDEYGVVGEYSPPNVFTISHPPAAGALSPNNVPITYASTLLVEWKFTDPSPTDQQSAFQVVLTRSDTGAIVHDSGKIFGTINKYAIPIADETLKDVLLEWTVQLWDTDDVAGGFVPPALVTLVDPSTATITSPTDGEVLTTAIPNVTVDVEVGGTRSIVKYRVRFLQGGTVAANSQWTATVAFSGDTLSWTPPIEALANNTSYTIEVILEDNLGIRSTPATVTVATEWVPPATASWVAADVTPYNTEGQGWVAVGWTDENRDVDFSRYIIWRKIRLLDPLTNDVLEEMEWEEIAEVTDFEELYVYRDYTAPSGHEVSYRVEQEVVRYGDVLASSDGTPWTVAPYADSYWLIEPEAFNAFRLGIVTSDSYTEEYEEAEYLIIGRGTHVEQGEREGYKGTLTSQIRNTNGISARQHKKRLEEVKKENRKLYLRNPFGDLFRVSVGSMQISRIAGVGASEFVDVTIPYTEVGA